MISSKRRQAGGTLIGFVVGLLVGLGVALSIAVYVTRVPVPFVDRGVSRSPAKDVEEAERNKGWNPNAPLAGKPAPLPTVPAGTATASAPEATSTTATAAPAAGARPAEDPLGDLLNAKLGQGATPAAAPDKDAAAAAADPFIYFVQAGAFRTPEEADAQRAKLAMLGVSADITEREQSGKTIFRVRVGPFHDKALADATREQLVGNGVESALVRINR